MGRKAIPMETIVCVEHILLDRTDADRGELLKISEIGELLKEYYGVEVSDDAVRRAAGSLCSETLTSPKGAAAGVFSPSFHFIRIDGRTPVSPKRYAVKRN